MEEAMILTTEEARDAIDALERALDQTCAGEIDLAKSAIRAVIEFLARQANLQPCEECKAWTPAFLLSEKQWCRTCIDAEEARDTAAREYKADQQADEAREDR
jgi:hypothetical protein